MPHQSPHIGGQHLVLSANGIGLGRAISTQALRQRRLYECCPCQHDLRLSHKSVLSTNFNYGHNNSTTPAPLDPCQQLSAPQRRVEAGRRHPVAAVERVRFAHRPRAQYQLFAWRKLFGDGQLAPSEKACALLPVTLAAPALAQHVPEQILVSPGVIEQTVGKARLRLEGTVEAAVLNLVLQRLLP